MCHRELITHFPGSGLWDEEDGFYYDVIRSQDNNIVCRTRSMVGLLPLMAVLVLEDDVVKKLPGFKKRLDWFIRNRKDMKQHVSPLLFHFYPIKWFILILNEKFKDRK